MSVSQQNFYPMGYDDCECDKDILQYNFYEKYGYNVIPFYYCHFL